jgi:hypothetical protein
MAGRLVPRGKFQLRLAGEPAGGSITGAVGLDDRTASAFAGLSATAARRQPCRLTGFAPPAEVHLRDESRGPFGSNSRCAVSARVSSLPQLSRIRSQISPPGIPRYFFHIHVARCRAALGPFRLVCRCRGILPGRIRSGRLSHSVLLPSRLFGHRSVEIGHIDRRVTVGPNVWNAMPSTNRSS